MFTQPVARVRPTADLSVLRHGLVRRRHLCRPGRHSHPDAAGPASRCKPQALSPWVKKVRIGLRIALDHAPAFTGGRSFGASRSLPPMIVAGRGDPNSLLILRRRVILRGSILAPETSPSPREYKGPCPRERPSRQSYRAGSNRRRPPWPRRAQPFDCLHEGRRVSPAAAAPPQPRGRRNLLCADSDAGIP